MHPCKYAIRWPSGHIDQAATWHDLEKEIFRAQKIVPSKTLDEFRHDMAQRALAWSNTTIDISGPSATFIAELCRARLCERIRSH